MMEGVCRVASLHKVTQCCSCRSQWRLQYRCLEGDAWRAEAIVNKQNVTQSDTEEVKFAANLKLSIQRCLCVPSRLEV